MIAKLQKEAEEDATKKANCDEEVGKTEAKQTELDISKLNAKTDKAAATSGELAAKRKEQVKELQDEHGPGVPFIFCLKSLGWKGVTSGRFAKTPDNAQLTEKEKAFVRECKLAAALRKGKR